MSLLYDRKYRLVVGEPDNIIYTGDTNINVGVVDTIKGLPLYEDYRTEDGTAVEITDLHFEAEISGDSNTGNQASCILRIYNLSEDTRSVVEKLNNYVILNAGYSGDQELAMVFSGQVFDFNTEKQGADLVTTLKCKDGYVPNNGVRISKVYPKTFTGADGKEKYLTYGDVLEDLADIFSRNGIPTGQLVTSPEDKGYTETDLSLITDNKQLFQQLLAPADVKLLRGYSAIGFLRQIMDKVCNSLGYVWYITNGRLFCHPKGYTATVSLYKISTDQMLSIRRTGSQQPTTSTGKGDEGVRIITFLDGRLDTDKRLEVLDGQYAGDYKIISKSHSLNYRNGQWLTTIDCKKA